MQNGISLFGDKGVMTPLMRDKLKEVDIFITHTFTGAEWYFRRPFFETGTVDAMRPKMVNCVSLYGNLVTNTLPVSLYERYGPTLPKGAKISAALVAATVSAIFLSFVPSLPTEPVLPLPFGTYRISRYWLTDTQNGDVYDAFTSGQISHTQSGGAGQLSVTLGDSGTENTFFGACPLQFKGEVKPTFSSFTVNVSESSHPWYIEKNTQQKYQIERLGDNQFTFVSLNPFVVKVRRPNLKSVIVFGRFDVTYVPNAKL